MHFTFLLIQNLFFYFSEFSNGTEQLMSNFTNPKQLTLEETFWYKTQKEQYLVLLKQSRINLHEVYVLMLNLPFEKDQVTTNQIEIRNSVINISLEELFSRINYKLYYSTWLVKINANESEYFNFELFKRFEMTLAFFENHLYSYSNFNLLETSEDNFLFDRFDYGVKYFNTKLVFDNTFLFIGTKFVYVVYKYYSSDSNDESRKQITRNFLVESIIVWTETITEGNKVFLSENTKSLNWHLTWPETKNEKDKFTFPIGSNKLGLTFAFSDEAETVPKVCVDETELYGTTKELNSLELAAMTVSEIDLGGLDMLRVITPKFIFSSNFSVTHIAFFVYYDSFRYSAEYGKMVRQNYQFIFYSLDRPDFSLFTGIMHKRSSFIIIVLKKVLENGCLYFKTETNLEIFPKNEYELSQVSDGSRSDLDWVYTYLEMFSHKSVNGSFVGSNKEKDQTSIAGSNLKKNSRLFRKNGSVLFIMLVLVFIGFSLVVLFWVRKTYLTKKKLGRRFRN